jgi:acetylornithine deacetylase
MMMYAMTHPQSRMTDPWDARLIDTKEGRALRGRGISEQKAPLAATLAAMEALFAAGGFPKGHLVFVLSSAGETGRHDAAQAAMAGHAAAGTVPAMGIVGLGTNGRVALGNKGRIDVDIVIHGKATHSSTPWDGIDAIEGARRVLDQLKHIDLPAREHAGLGRVTLTPTRVTTGPNATHTVQDSATITIDRRLLPGEDPELALTQITECVQLPAPWRVEVRRGPFMYPCEIPVDGPLVSRISEGARHAGLAVPDTFYSHSSLDAGYLLKLGCEATMWGPGRVEQFHSDDEFVLVSELVEGARGYAGFLGAALG